MFYDDMIMNLKQRKNNKNLNYKIEYKRLEIFATLWSYSFARLIPFTFKLGNFTNFKAPFSVLSTDFSELVHVKS